MLDDPQNSKSRLEKFGSSTVVAAVVNLVAALIVAGSAAFVNRAINKQTNDLQRSQNEQTVKIQRVQTIGQFFPYLLSDDQEKQKSAILVISELVDPQLAIRMARSNPTPGGTSALRTLAKTAPLPADRQAAQVALQETILPQTLPNEVLRPAIQSNLLTRTSNSTLEAYINYGKPDFGSVAVGLESTPMQLGLLKRISEDREERPFSATLSGPFYFENGSQKISGAVREFMHLTVLFRPANVGDAKGGLRFDGVDLVRPRLHNPQKLTGSGFIGTPNLSVSTLKLDFETVSIGETVEQSVVFKNSGTGDLKMVDIEVTGEFKRTNSCPKILKPEQDCRVALAFAPSVEGLREGKLVITHNAEHSPIVVLLSGVGEQP